MISGGFELFSAAGLHVSMPAEHIFSIGSFSVTNALIYGAIFYALLAWLMYAVVRAVRGKSKPNFITRLVVWIFETLYRSVEEIIGDKRIARKVAPLSISIFFFVIVQYWSGILPVVGPITVDGVPLFRSMVADLNMTFALAIITIVAAQVYAARHLGFWKNFGRYFVNPFRDPIGAFVGLLEFIAELSRTLGLSFRLFGNVFAGEILLVVIGSLAQHFGVLALPPFYLFELFIGAVQAYIFFMLATIFASLGLASHGDDHAVETPTSLSHQSVANKPVTVDELM